MGVGTHSNACMGCTCTCTYEGARQYICVSIGGVQVSA